MLTAYSALQPFLIMQNGKKVYGALGLHMPSVQATHYSSSQGFTVSLYEYPATIPTLWDTVKGTVVLPLFPIISDLRL